MIKAIAQPLYINPPNDIKTIEMLKQMNANMQQAFENMYKQMQPIQNFITDIQKEIEEEEKEKSE